MSENDPVASVMRIKKESELLTGLKWNINDYGHIEKEGDNGVEDVSSNSDVSDLNNEEYEEDYFDDSEGLERLSDISSQDNDNLERVSDISEFSERLERVSDISEENDNLERVSDISDVNDRLESVSDISEDEIVLDEEFSDGLESVSDVSDDIIEIADNDIIEVADDDIIEIADNDQQTEYHSSSNRYKRSIEPQLSSSNNLMPALKKSKITNSNGGANERFLREFLNGNRSTSLDLEYADAIIKQRERELNDKKKRLLTETCDESEIVVQFGKQTSPDLEYADAIIKQRERELNDKKKRLSTETCDESEIVVQFGKQIPQPSVSTNCMPSSTDYDYYKRGDDYDGSFESPGKSYPEINLERYAKRSSLGGNESYPEISSDRYRGSREISHERSIDKYRDISRERSHERYPERRRGSYDEIYDEKCRASTTERSPERWRERSSQDDESLQNINRVSLSDQELTHDENSDNRRLPYDRKKTQDITILPYDRTNPETLICDDRRLPVASQNNESSERKLLLEKKLKLMDDIEKLLEQNEDASILPKIDDIVSKISNDIDSKRKSLSDYRLYPLDHRAEGLHPFDVPNQESLQQSKVSDHQPDGYHEGLNHSNVYYQENSYIPLSEEITGSSQNLAVNNHDHDDFEELSDEDINEIGKKRRKGLTTECKYYSKGMCKWGSKCRFPHPGEDGQQAGPSSLPVQALDITAEILEDNKEPGAAFFASPFGKLLGSSEPSFKKAVHQRAGTSKTVVGNAGTGSSETRFCTETGSSQTAVHSQVTMPPVINPLVTSNHAAAVSQLAAANASSYSNSQQIVAANTGPKWSKPALKINSKEPMEALYEFSQKKYIAPPWYNAVQAKGYSPINTVWMTCKIDGKEFSATGCTNMVAKKNVAYVAWEAIKEEYINFLSL